MPTSSLVSDTQAISITHPSLFIPQTECRHSPISAIDDSGQIQLSDSLAHLHPDTKLYLLTELQSGRITQARRVALCYTYGRVYLECIKKDYAKAHPILCHDEGCRLCGRAISRLAKWLRNRDSHELYSDATQFGIELSLPWSGTKRAGLAYLLHSAKRLAKALAHSSPSAVSTLSHAVLDPSTSEVRVRMCVQGCHPSFYPIRAAWAKIEPTGRITTERKLDPEKLLQWTFEGAQSLLMLPGDLRSSILLPIRGLRYIRTSGHFYRPVSKAILDKIRAERKSEDHAAGCPCCHSELVAKQDHLGDTIQNIQERYSVVDWGRSDIAERLKSMRDNRANCIDLGPMELQRSRYGPN